MKRIFSIILCFVVCFSFVIPVSASSIDEQTTFDLLDYAYEDEFTYSPRSTSFDWTITFDTVMLRYVDMVVYCNQSISSASIGSSPLKVSYINSGYYRIYGTFVNYGSSLSIHFVFLNSASTFQVVSAQASTLVESFYYVGGNLDLSGGSLSSSTFNGSDSVSLRINPYSPSGQRSFSLRVSSSAFKNYDFVTLNFQLDRTTISSISAIHDSFNILHSISYLDTDGNYIDLTDSNIILQDYLTGPIYVRIVLDLTNIDRSSTNIPSVFITGSYLVSDSDVNSNNDRIFLYVTNVCGLLLGNFDIQTVWYKRFFNSIVSGFDGLSNLLQNLISGNSEDQTAADAFQDSVDEQASQFEDMSNTMNQVERPPIESIELSADSMVDSNSVVLATNGIGTIVNNPIILRVILMALTLALAGFVLYGKR